MAGWKAAKSSPHVTQPVRRASDPSDTRKLVGPNLMGHRDIAAKMKGPQSQSSKSAGSQPGALSGLRPRDADRPKPPVRCETVANLFGWPRAFHRVITILGALPPMKLTTEMIMDHRTAKGGWTNAQFAALGLEVPPRHGWLRRLVGTDVTDQQWREFVAGAGVYAPEFNRRKRRDDHGQGTFDL